MTLRAAIVLVFAICAGTAFVFPWLLRWGRPRSRAVWLLWALDITLCEWILYQQTDWTLASVYLRYPPVLLAAYCMATSWPRAGAAPLPGHGAPRRSLPLQIVRGLGLCFGAGALALLVTVLLELQQSDTLTAVALDWPLGPERGFVLQGGASQLRNHHVPVQAQQRALDVVALGAAGKRMVGLFPAELSRYSVYGAQVHAPCTGEVTAVENGCPDRQPLADEQTAHLAGNFVALYCAKENVTVVLAHLQRGVPVALGERLRSGQVLGRVGNSGSTTEPHLHIHAVRGRVSSEEELLGATASGLAMSFHGQRLARGDWFGSD
ncbi:MAG: hypothetical protein RL385_2388 [Pseudomonadota bacterium]